MKRQALGLAAFGGDDTTQASITPLSHNCRFRRKGVGSVTNAPEDGFSPGTTDASDGRVTLVNRFAFTPHSLRQEFIPLPGLPPDSGGFSRYPAYTIHFVQP